jgi:hypothetical protein
MDIQSVISVVGLLGIGGVLGSYFANIYEKRKLIDLKGQDEKQKLYRSVVTRMQALIDPTSLEYFSNDPFFLEKHSSNNKETAQASLRNELVVFHNILHLYAPDEILRNIRLFLEKPCDEMFKKTALSMRNDLWRSR